MLNIKTEHQDIELKTNVEIVHQMVQNIPQFKNYNKEDINEWLKVAEADPDCQLLTIEEIVESLNECNENNTDSNEDGKNATNTNYYYFDPLKTVLKWAETEVKIDCIELLK